MRDMHIYSQKEYHKKQESFIRKAAFSAAFISSFYLKPSVIKNYVYYSVPVKID